VDSRIVYRDQTREDGTTDVSTTGFDGRDYKSSILCELQLAASPELYRIEKILSSRRGVDGKVRHYVKWMGYPSKFNSWIDEISNVAN